MCHRRPRAALRRRLRARPLLLSPADFRRAQDWYARGIPRWLIERSLEELFERARAADRAPPRSLAYCANAVEEAFKAWRAIQVPAPSFEGAAAGEELAALLARAADRIRESTAPQAARAGALSVLERLARGEACEGRDVLMKTQRALVEACWESLSASEQAELGGRVESQVAPFRERMAPELLERAARRAQEQEILRRFGLPDISLLPLLGG